MADVEEARSRLREWAYYFRDRPTKGKAGSAEGNWRSPQVWEAQKPKPVVSLLRAIETQGLLKQLPTPNHRALAWRFAYPWLPLSIPLRHLSRRLGHRVNLKEYDELVQIGEYRLAVLIDTQQEVLYSPPPLAGAARRVFTV